MLETADQQQVDLQQQLQSAQVNAEQPTLAESGNMEHYEKLQNDLQAAQQEVEALRAAATAINRASNPTAGQEDGAAAMSATISGPDTTIDTTVSDATVQAPIAQVASTQEGPVTSTVPGDAVSSTIADQVASQVAQLRHELEEQHKASQQQLESNYVARTESMKKQLNNKLRETKEKVKEEARAELITEHSQEIEKLKQEHEVAMDTLREEHRQIVERLTREGAEAVEKAASTPNAASVAAVETKSETQNEEAAQDKAEPNLAEMTFTDEQVKELAQKNVIIQNIIKRNILNRVNQVKEEHEKAMQENTEKAEKDKVKAVNMETMKQKAKLGMAEGSSRAAKAKLDVVESAAKETPQRPVVEVWEIAKNAKAAAPVAPPAAAPTTSAQVAAASPTQATANAQLSHGGIPTPGQQDRMQSRQARFGAPSVAPTSAATQQAGLAQSGSFGQPSFIPNQIPNPGAGTAPNGTLAQPARRPSGPPIASTQNPVNSPGAASTSQLAPGLPQKPVQASGTGQAATRGAGGGGIPRGNSMLPRGGPAGRGGRGGLPQPSQVVPGQPQQTQGIPVQGVAGGQTQRGGVQSGLPRGGRGGGRGGTRGGIQTAQGANLNADAKQFTPGVGQQQGAKRPNDGGTPQGDEKRLRGGGPTA